MKVLRSCMAAMALAAAILPASAADIPVETFYQPRPAVVLFRWTGVHVGLHVGGAFGSKDETPVPFGLLLSAAPNPCPVLPAAVRAVRRDRAVTGQRQCVRLACRRTNRSGLSDRELGHRRGGTGELDQRQGQHHMRRGGHTGGRGGNPRRRTARPSSTASAPRRFVPAMRSIAFSSTAKVVLRGPTTTTRSNSPLPSPPTCSSARMS